MSDIIFGRPFALARDVDHTGPSGTGIVADGVLWPDDTVSIRWRGKRPSIVFWHSLADAMAVHGHDGSTRVVWEPLGLPQADYGSVWSELCGYVQQVDDEGGTIAPGDLLLYLHELKTRALAPVRAWMDRVRAGAR